MNDLALFESSLMPLRPKFADVLGRIMPPERLIRTIVVSCERNPNLLSANRQTLLNAAMTFAVLGLEVDGITGQGFLVPFKDRERGEYVVQPIIGYLGYNTLGARAGYTITGRVVREGDVWEFDEADGTLVHQRKLGGEVGSQARRIVAVWARAAAVGRPPILRVMSIDEILAVQAKAPGGKRAPWTDHEGPGRVAMIEKTCKRRLRRDMPLSVYQAAGAMEEQHEELGRLSWINPDKGVMIDGGEVIRPSDNTSTPTMEELVNPPDLRAEARMAAERGRDAFAAFCKRLERPQYAQMKDYLLTLKPIVEAAENERGQDSAVD
jgi:phage RecT family recombinase